eukprot:GEMP01080873.1.p2 GENE.GEMP01080873.1~~GEMP01080873.1.p2  ORF type:complete len:143 (+),score=30.86 GEMP01080873.1:80-508(+)
MYLQWSIQRQHMLVVAAAFLKKDLPDYGPGDEHRLSDSFGQSTLEPPCSKIECGAMSCDAPFELKTDNTCCGYCWAPDHVVSLDRHTASNSPYKTDAVCDSAPSSCRGPGPAASCFQPSCRTGEAPHCSPGACCPRCGPTGQ